MDARIHYFSLLLIRLELCHFINIQACIKVFYYQLMQKIIVLKRSIKIYIIITPKCFGVITIIRECTLPDDDHTKTCWSYFNVNFNTPFQNNSLVHQLAIKKTLLIARCKVQM